MNEAIWVGFILLGLVLLVLYAVCGIWIGYKVGVFIGQRVGELLGKIL